MNTRDYNDDSFFQCLEKFSSLTHQVSCNLDIFMRIIHDTEFPNSVEATQKLLDEQGTEYERLKVGWIIYCLCVCVGVLFFWGTFICE